MDQEPASEPPTPLTSLLDEISWEGNARKYRGGGRGTENALTAEVFDALDILPRSTFLGRVLAAATGADAAREALISTIEDADVTVLPGDLAPRPQPSTGGEWRIQPDAILSSEAAYCLVEAKRIRGGSLQPRQLARTAITAHDRAEGRGGMVLLVLGSPPPVVVRGRGRHDLASAMLLDETPGWDLPDPLLCLAWITWHRIAEVVDESSRELRSPDPSVAASIRRLADRIGTVVRWHDA